MKLNSKYISLIVLSFILVLVAGISFLSFEKSDVEEVYAAVAVSTVPDGFVLVPYNVSLPVGTELYIDTSVSNPLGFTSFQLYSNTSSVSTVSLTNSSLGIYGNATNMTNLSMKLNYSGDYLRAIYIGNLAFIEDGIIIGWGYANNTFDFNGNSFYISSSFTWTNSTYVNNFLYYKPSNLSYNIVPPAHYVHIEPNVLYTNVSIFVDTSLAPSSFSTNIDMTGTSSSKNGVFYYSTGYSNSAYISIFGTGSIAIKYPNGQFLWNYSAFNIDGTCKYVVPRLNLTTSPNWLYVYSPPSPVTQSLPITFDSGVSSVSLGNQTWSSSGASNSVVFDNENNTYTFNVTLNNSVLRSVTYNLSSDTTVGGILNATISGSSFTCECPVGDSIESITIYTNPLIYSSPCVITFDEHIQKIECDGIEWTASGQSNDIYYDLTSGSMSLTFDVTLSNGYIVDDYSIRMTGGLMTSSLNGNQLTVSGISSSCDSIQSISFTSELLTVGVLTYLQTWFLNSEDNYIGAIDYSNTSETYVLPRFTISSLNEPFMDYLELYDYVYSLISSSQMLFQVRQYNITGCVYLDGSAVSFPLTVSNYDSSKGGILFTTKRVQSSTAFSAPSSFVYLSDFGNLALPYPVGGYDFTTPFVYSVAPYALSSPLSPYDWYIVLREGAYPTGVGVDITNVHLYIDNQLIDYFTCDLDFNSNLRIKGINLSPVSSYLLDLSNSNGVVYYLDNVIYSVSSSNNVTELYFSSNQSNWSPSVLDAFSYLGQIFDNVFDILDLQITRDITLGTILLIVLSLGVLLFIFRISGVF